MCVIIATKITGVVTHISMFQVLVLGISLLRAKNDEWI